MHESISDLISTPTNLGVEVDIRSFSNALVTSHDPFTQGPELKEWLQYYKHRTLILNVKEEGLEEKLIPLVETAGINDYFILDESFPYIVKWARSGLIKFGVRVSDLEGLDSPNLLLQHGLKVEWVWLDRFDHDSFDSDHIKKFQHLGYKVCLVSPELHYLAQPDIWNKKLEKYFVNFTSHSSLPDAVCTKLPNLWADFSIKYKAIYK